MQTEAFFTDIREVLVREIGLARQSIHVAVAWFTDRVIFAALLKRQRAGIHVSLCITQDDKDINFQPNGLAFAQLEAAGGRFWVIENRLMHHKFCILDGRDVLTGSYNWTNKAARSNEENLVLTTGDPELAHSFLREFRRLTGQEQQTSGDPTVQRIMKRLGVIQALLALEDAEDLPKHIERIEAESITDSRLTTMLAALRAHRYAEATTLLQAFVAAYSQVRIWEDPLVSALQLEIRMLEAEMLALEAERSEDYRLLMAFELWHQRELGGLLQDVLGLRRDVARYNRQESQYSESEYQRAKERYDQQARAREQAQEVQSHTFALDDTGRSLLKKMHREAIQLCHPDRVALEYQSAATPVFHQVQNAYERQDLAELQVHLVSLRRGIFTIVTTALTSVEVLRARRDALASKHAEILHDLTHLRGSEAFALAQADEEVKGEYLTTNRAALETERERLVLLYSKLSEPVENI